VKHIRSRLVAVTPSQLTRTARRMSILFSARSDGLTRWLDGSTWP
jgi:hypothetical protein